MGITLQKLQKLRDVGALHNHGKVLDIGSSNLYQAAPADIDAFASSFGVHLEPKFRDQLSRGSAYGSNGGLNESFVGELLEKIGLTYLAFDIANGFRTQIFDLNRETLPAELKGTFDVVLNFGTTEHVINQLNSFRVIHDATKVGGHIVHELPTAGYLDHGYFCYTPRFFFDLSGHNEYELIDFTYQGPFAGNDIYAIVRDYQVYFPTLANGPPEYRMDFWSRLSRKLKLTKPEIKADNISSYLILRKTKDLPLRLPMETSTSVHVSG